MVNAFQNMYVGSDNAVNEYSYSSLPPSPRRVSFRRRTKLRPHARHPVRASVTIVVLATGRSAKLFKSVGFLLFEKHSWHPMYKTRRYSGAGKRCMACLHSLSTPLHRQIDHMLEILTSRAHAHHTFLPHRRLFLHPPHRQTR